MDWMWWRMEREPSVSWLPNRGSSPGAWTTTTRSQSAPISSASTMGRLVRTPVPISARCATRVTVPSGSMETKTSGFVTIPWGISSPPVWYRSKAPAGVARATSAKALPRRKSRRSSRTMRRAVWAGRASTRSRMFSMAQIPVAARRTAATMRW